MWLPRWNSASSKHMATRIEIMYMDKVIIFKYSGSFELKTISFCKRKLQINYNTIVDWNNYLVEVCMQIYY